MTMKKMISLALAACMALSLAVPAGAEAISESPESTFRVNCKFVNDVLQIREGL